MDQFDNSSLTRRRALQLLGGTALAASLDVHAATPLVKTAPAAYPKPYRYNTAEDVFLEDLTKRACLYFWEQASPKTGQVRDRAFANGGDPRRVASIAATGFGLTALCIAERRGYLSASDVRQRVKATLRYHLEQMPNERGFFYHFTDMESGKRMWNCEVSSIDTSIFLCGALTCRTYFRDSVEIQQLATKLYERVDWPWMLNGGLTFCMAWYPETGFAKAHWDTYAELMMLYLLAIGSPTHPIEATFWKNIARPYYNFSGYHFISTFAPLFAHQYSHAWYDFRHKHDAYTDYFANSILATRAHKEFCMSLDREYTDDYWGISASDSQHGYTAWGGPPVMGKIDGSVTPCAAAGSLPFLPKECLHVLTSLHDKYAEKAWGRYGFCDAFHPSAQWYDPDVLGIDQGITLLMAENLRTGLIWDTFMLNPEAKDAMTKVGFHAAKVIT